MQSAFQAALAATVQLAHPREDPSLVLAVDASATHVYGVLQQRDCRGTLRPLGVFSKKLDAAQQKYSAFDWELPACYLAICHFR